MNWVVSLLRPNTSEGEQQPERQIDESPFSFRGTLKRHIENHGGPFTFWCQAMRVLSGFALLVLHIVAIRHSQPITPDKGLLEQDGVWTPSWGQNDGSLTRTQIINLSFGAVYVGQSLGLRDLA